MSKIHDDLNVKLPIWSAGMGLGIAGPALTAAVSEARGLGVLGIGGLSPQQIEHQITDVRRRTSRAFGVNVILPLIQSHEIEACFDARVPLMVLFWGDPAPYVNDAHRRGIKILVQCGNAEEAAQAAEAGVDGVLVQGSEAGGHVKATEPLATTLSETIRELGKLPVVAAGGIATGEDIAKALTDGASAVSMGTRFLASREAQVTDEYKDRVVRASAEHTVLTELFDVGWPNAQHRVIRNETYNRWESQGRKASGERAGEDDVIGTLKSPEATTEVNRYTILPPLPDLQADPEDLPLYAGESCDKVNNIPTAAELMRELHEGLRKAAN